MRFSVDSTSEKTKSNSLTKLCEKQMKYAVDPETVLWSQNEEWKTKPYLTKKRNIWGNLVILVSLHSKMLII